MSNRPGCSSSSYNTVLKISTFVPITLAMHLVASRNHRGCMHTYHCRARAARHYITLSSKGIGLTRICTLLTRLPQNVDCIIIIESYPQYFYLETRHQLVDFRVNGSAKRRIGRSAGSMSTSSSPIGVAAGVRFRRADDR